MKPLVFRNDDFFTVGEALHIAEDVTGNFYKFSIGQWSRHRYDVKTWISLRGDEISSYAFALLNKGVMPAEGSRGKENRSRDIYWICLQDHHILSAVGRDAGVTLLPLLVYVFTHELVHIIRFSSFAQRYDVSDAKRQQEETVVHATTYEILNRLSLPKLDHVLNFYRGHRICDVALS